MRIGSLLFRTGQRRVRRAGRLGFTLLELMVVLAIVTVLSVAAVPAVEGTISSIQLKGSANSVIAQLDLARQTASARNLPVQVRLYQDTTKSRDNNGNFPFRILAIVIPASISGAASDEFVGHPEPMTGDVIIDSGSNYSSILNPAAGSPGMQPIAATELTTAPAAVQSLPYIGFDYLANGRLALDPRQQWCLTILNQKKAYASNSSGPAANFVSLIFDVQTSRTTTYQP
ncbi:MAG TPA: Verru_Chthon cassette protein D [Chthoniobacteraceae bacterium]|jgi:uncharacterized protein (TIGR02596 family)|nr:Verru_Chthon cassette protein D [Chthoniobacteraceae bacterium]